MSESDRVKPKPKIEPPQEQQYKPAPEKTEKSPFDKVLEQTQVLQKSPLMQNRIAQQEGARHGGKEAVEKYEKDGKKEKTQEKEDSKGKEKTRDGSEKSDTATRNAVSRGSGKQGSGGKSDGGGGKSGGRGELAKKQMTVINKKIADARALMSEIGKSAFAEKLAKVQMAAKITPQQMQAIVNQVVQAVKLGKNEIGESELMLILRKPFFSGLRLRFTSKDGKVQVQFETSSREAKDLFTVEADNIKSALKEKGVDVSDIRVV